MPLVFAAVVPLLCSVASAQTAPPVQLTEDQKKSVGENRQFAVELGINVGAHLFRAGQDAQGLNNAFHGDIRVGYRVLRPLSIEVGFGITPTSSSDRTLNIVALNPHLDVNFDLLQFRVRPYLGIGFGGMIYTSQVANVAFLEGHFQAGVKIAIWKDLAFRAEFKGLFHPSANPAVGTNRSFGYFVNGIVTGGFMYSFGGKPYRVDRDGDSIYDEDDKCPDIPGEAAYEGCPPPVDSDGDGIMDDKDQCPDVPGLAEYNGCPPPDQDGDGVTDDKDKCPAEPGPASNQGCPEVVLEDNKILTRQARFETNKADILPEYSAVLDELANFMKRHVEIELVAVHGHTDIEGTRQRNQALSNERAEAVLGYLVSKGVEKSRLQAKGFGQDKPIASNRTPEGKAKNRRVEFVVLQKNEGKEPKKLPKKEEPKKEEPPPTPPPPVEEKVDEPKPLPVEPTPAPAPAPEPKKEEKGPKPLTPKEEPKKEEPKPTPAPEPKKEEPKPAGGPKPLVPKEEPKPAGGPKPLVPKEEKPAEPKPAPVEPKKEEPKPAPAPAPVEPKKPEVKKEEAKPAEPKKEEPKKEDPKKRVLKKEEKKAEEPAPEEEKKEEGRKPLLPK
ncbi:MAG: OmpA family protein [Deltaproteobacteria bacterium]|nr:OmpA family protein [Deltaproteobacteria bacterium]